MAQIFNGSICLTDLIEKAKQKHSAFAKSKNGKIYANLFIWLNDEPNEYGNIGSLSLNSKKEFKDKEERAYVGNFKMIEKSEPQPLSDNDVSSLHGQGLDLHDDLPF